MKENVERNAKSSKKPNWSVVKKKMCEILVNAVQMERKSVRSQF